MLPTECCSRGLDVRRQTHTNSRLDLQINTYKHTHTQKHSPGTDCLSEIGTGNMGAQIAPYSPLVFQQLETGRLTRRGRAVGKLGVVWGQTGPRLGLHVNVVHILEHTEKHSLTSNLYEMSPKPEPSVQSKMWRVKTHQVIIHLKLSLTTVLHKIEWRN